ncbi:ImmA/IrrE family metallo-endopeptidase [Variovorax sp. LT1R16]|uniref:ImmA/IrrE family metallo-endopeptidase n=1 Tax=Variovorax sp. LT1R16 TaxID=3443728 RepID=UPI003F464074
MTATPEPYQLRGHIVPPRRVVDIRQAAEGVRGFLKLPDGKVDLEPFLESLSQYGLTVDVMEDDDFTLMMAGVEAVCIPETATIMLTSQTYQAARRNDPRTRFTIFHELGHFMLQHTKTLPRKNVEAKAYIDSEWQADQFSAEMTMPLKVIKARSLLTATKVAGFFGVSIPAAQYRLRQLQRQQAL